MEEYMLPCLNKSLFGVDCFGCGGQRALLMVFRAEFHQAFIMFPAIYPILFLFCFLILNLFVKFRYDFQIKIALIIFSGAVMLISYLIKMNNFIQLTQ
ncbi:uncharacterized protein DUF2752 [Salegentibacter sp. 24]|uniref:DUF2752 domain-containing protein n=1 Tax=Salegentibacter sp. 24 TaxID=2183986 RepID=UPI0010612AD0|nr:DUF2752 domain-containing protein [Salegentibacter sp. 24]TDN81266.1 uncharacterized protein DUF2752 [Salegentibacter sp. 24]